VKWRKRMLNKEEMISGIKKSKKISEDKVTISDAGIEFVNFKDGQFMPDDLMKLTNYYHDLCKENMIHFVSTGERVPSITNIHRITEEIQVDADRLDGLLFAGEMLCWQDSLSELNDVEYDRACKEVYCPEEYALDDEDMIDLQDHMDKLAQDIKKRHEEIDMLNKMFTEGEDQ
jgi:hypothetical protein